MERGIKFSNLFFIIGVVLVVVLGLVALAAPRFVYSIASILASVWLALGVIVFIFISIIGVQTEGTQDRHAVEAAMAKLLLLTVPALCIAPIVLGVKMVVVFSATALLCWWLGDRNLSIPHKDAQSGILPSIIVLPIALWLVTTDPSSMRWVAAGLTLFAGWVTGKYFEQRAYTKHRDTQFATITAELEARLRTASWSAKPGQ